ncbi:hypothetical protein BGZ63DRAFT_457996 [Mariannaea sp. PMI_226]|nr:hypothetical protein BGZ63DRAFT_457996 [Mariannaea sp. PMI_226]
MASSAATITIKLPIQTHLSDAIAMPSPTETSVEGGGHGLSPGEIIGIVVGSVGFLAFILTAVFMVIRNLDAVAKSVSRSEKPESRRSANFKFQPHDSEIDALSVDPLMMNTRNSDPRQTDPLMAESLTGTGAAFMTDPVMDTPTADPTEVESYYEPSSGTREQPNEQASESGLSFNSDSVSGSSGIATTFEAHQRHAVEAMMAEARLMLRQSPLVGMRIRAGGRESSSQLSVAHSADTVDSGTRIVSWERGQQRDNNPTIMCSEKMPTNPRLEEAKLARGFPPRRIATPYGPVEMEHTHVTELADTSPPVELHDAAISPSGLTEELSHLADKYTCTYPDPACFSGSSRMSQDTSRSSKRSRESNDNFRASDDDDGDGGSEPKKFKQAPVSDGLTAPKLACPFYRRNPKKHLKLRSCAGPGWASIHRVKEHIYRCHMLPIHCPRCGMVFSSESLLKTHQRLPEGCAVQLVNFPEGIDKEQEVLLRKRKKKGTEEEKWFDVYRILFPDEDGDLIPSPYYDKHRASEMEDELAQYERFQRRELLRVVRKLLEETVSGLAEPMGVNSEASLSTSFEKHNAKYFSLSAAYDLVGTEPSFMPLGESGIPREFDRFNQDFAMMSRMEMGLATSPTLTSGDGGDLQTHENGVQVVDNVPVNCETDISHAGIGGSFNSLWLPGDPQLDMWYQNGGLRPHHD